MQFSTFYRGAPPLTAAGLLVAATAVAQVPPVPSPLEIWGTNGVVRALASVGNTLFVGGEFDYVGPPSGDVAIFDVSDSAALTGRAYSGGRVRAMAADGAGGWFVAGPVPAAPERQTLQHLRPNGTPDPVWQAPDLGISWDPPYGFVNRLVVGGGRLYVAGNFMGTDGARRSGLLALDATTGALLPWSPTFAVPSLWSHGSQSLAVSNGRLFIGGLFTTVNGEPRHGLAAFDLATGALLPVDAPAGAGVELLAAVSSTRVYAWCSGGHLCAFDTEGIPVSTWTAPALTIFPSVALTETALFTVVYEHGHSQVVALDPDTGARQPWIGPRSRGAIRALAAANGRLYLAGMFMEIDGVVRKNLAAADSVTGRLLPWAPLVGDFAEFIIAQGGRVGVGGAFTSAGGMAARNLTAIDLSTGRARLMPDHTFPVLALQTVGDLVIAGGGTDTPSSTGTLSTYSASSNTRLPWALTTDGPVRALAASHDTLFVGGSFRHVNGHQREGLAAIRLATATLSNVSQNVLRSYEALAVSGDRLYVSGELQTSVGPVAVAGAFDATTLGLTPFRPVPSPAAVRGFAFGPGRVLLAGEMATSPTGAGWFAELSGQGLARSPTADYTAHRVGQHKGSVVVAGRFDRSPVLEIIDAMSGHGVLWDPHLGWYAVPAIEAVHVTRDLVVLAGVFGSARGIPVANLVVLRAGGATAPSRLVARTEATTATLGWDSGSPIGGGAYVVEAGTFPGTADVGRFDVGGVSEVTATLPPGRYYARVRRHELAGLGPPSSEVILDLPAGPLAPLAPGLTTGTVAGRQVTLDWGAAAGNAETYIVEAGASSGASDVGSLTTGHLDTRLVVNAPPGTYFVRVRAANTAGAGPAAEEIVVTVR